MMSLPELMRELQMVKGILKGVRGVHMAVKDSSSFCNEKKKKNTSKKTKQ